MSKMGQHVARMVDAYRPTLDEIERAEALRRESAPWEYELTDEALDAMDAPDGPLSGFNCYSDKEADRA